LNGLIKEKSKNIKWTKKFGSQRLQLDFPSGRKLSQRYAS